MKPATKKRSVQIEQLAGIQYGGEAGCSAECQDAVVRLLQHGDRIVLCRVLSSSRDHCLLLTINVGDLVAVKSGFASGYGGEGPSTFSYVLELLDAHNVEIEEYDVEPSVIERVDICALTKRDLKNLEDARPVRPNRWPDYIKNRHLGWRDGHTLWREFPPVIPYAIVDPRLFDLALSFWEGADERLLSAYRRLEDIVRDRTGLRDHGSKLFSRAFIGDGAVLRWPALDAGEQAVRGQLFTSAYGVHRNPRAHRELKERAEDQLSEFLLLNHLYRLESNAIVESLAESPSDP